MHEQLFGVLFPDIPGPRRRGYNVAVLKSTKCIELHISSNQGKILYSTFCNAVPFPAHQRLLTQSTFIVFAICIRVPSITPFSPPLHVYQLVTLVTPVSQRGR